MLSVDLAIRKGRLSLDARFEMTGGITVIQGPSGCGKTSLLRAIAGLDDHQGTVTVNDTAWQDGRHVLPVHQRRLGYVFQESSLLPHLTVEGNLRFILRRKAAEATRLDEVVRQTGIAALLPRGVSRLSGGERQRVALACALLPNPDLLLMDEPLSSLDQDARAELLPLIRALGLPTLYVTHDPAEAAFLTRRLFTIRDGRLIEAAPSADLLHGRSRAEIEALARAALASGLTPQE